MLKEIEAYVLRKRQWFKATEVLIEMVTTANNEQLLTTKERNTFRHQFILNYLNKGSAIERMHFIARSFAPLSLRSNQEMYELCFVEALCKSSS